MFNTEDDPKTFEEATAFKDLAFWKEIVNKEKDSKLYNNTLVLVDLPISSKPIGCKWCLGEKITPMDQFKPLKQGWWQKALNKGKEYTTLIPMHQWLGSHLFECCQHLYPYTS